MCTLPFALLRDVSDTCEAASQREMAAKHRSDTSQSSIRDGSVALVRSYGALRTGELMRP